MKRRFLIAGSVFALTVLGGAILVWGILPTSYSATAEIQDPRVGSTYSSDGGDEIFAATDPSGTGPIEDREVMMAVITTLNLSQTWGERGWGRKALSPEEALALLKKNLQIDLKRGSTTHVFEVTATGRTPEEALSIVNTMATYYKAKRDKEVASSEHQKEKLDLEGKIEIQEKGIREELAARDNLKSALVKKGIPIPSDDQVFAERNMPRNPKEDPQLSEYKRNEFLLGERQSFLNNFQMQLSMVDSMGVQHSPVQIVTSTEAHLVSTPRIWDMTIVVFAGILLGAGAATTLSRRSGISVQRKMNRSIPTA